MKSPTDRRTFIHSMTMGTVAVLAGAPAAIASSSNELKLETEFARYFVPTWMRAKDCTVEFCNAMPDKTYHFRPVPEIRSFAEQMLHIADSSIWMATNYLGGTNAPDRDYSAEGKTRDQVSELVAEAFDYIGDVFGELTDEQLHEEVNTFAGSLSKQETVLMIRDHVTHHRGQSVIYLRLNGIEPPAWVGH